MAQDLYPLYPAAIIFPLFAFPAWILDIPPMIWHFSQRNIAAGSLILWIVLANFFNSINALIWPRDNITEWWNGNVWCDINVRIQVASVVALGACVAMIMRRLAKVMDTRNITMAPSKNTIRREKALEIVWCWGYPLIMVVVYYIVQPFRYYIFAISGCVASYDVSWPSVVLSFVWGPITICFAAYYAGLLIYRLYRYRREFHRLVAARNTTKSRFVRLSVMGLIIIILYVPYSFFILWSLASQVRGKYDWNTVHGPNSNTVVRVPTNGTVRFDKWGQGATGYLAFIVFGTGVDAYSTYKRMLCSVGLGKIFPSLYKTSESGTATPSSVTFAPGWRSTLSNKAKNLFTRNGSVAEAFPEGSRNNSVTLEGSINNPSGQLHPVSTEEPILPRDDHNAKLRQSILSRIFSRRNCQQSLLPIHTNGTIDDSQAEKSPTDTVPLDIYTRA